MTPYVVDANVVALALLDEPGFERARNFLADNAPLLAPDLIHTEFANVLWKQHTRGRSTRDSAHELLTEFFRIRLQVTPSSQLIPRALELALQTRCTVYDSLYLALAVRSNSTLVTADKRLVNSLARTPLAPYLTSLDKAP